MSRHAPFPRASVLVLGANSIQALLPSTLISQADALLEAHRIEEAAELADRQRKKLQSLITVDEHEVCILLLDMRAGTQVEQADELRYVYQRLGLQCLTGTLFDDAGKHLFSGEMDPRVLMSYYPDLRGELFLREDVVGVFAGVAEHLPHEDSVDDISESPYFRPTPPLVHIRYGPPRGPARLLHFPSLSLPPRSPQTHFPPADSLAPCNLIPAPRVRGTDPVAANLVLNYSPHLPPNTREAPPAVELRNVLQMTARDMLEVYLRKWRTKLKMEDLKRAQHLQPIIVVSDDSAQEVS